MNIFQFHMCIALLWYYFGNNICIHFYDFEIFWSGLCFFPIFNGKIYIVFFYWKKKRVKKKKKTDDHAHSPMIVYTERDHCWCYCFCKISNNNDSNLPEWAKKNIILVSTNGQNKRKPTKQTHMCVFLSLYLSIYIYRNLLYI